MADPVQLAPLLAQVVVGGGAWKARESPEELDAETLGEGAVVEIFRLDLPVPRPEIPGPGCGEAEDVEGSREDLAYIGERSDLEEEHGQEREDEEAIQSALRAALFTRGEGVRGLVGDDEDAETGREARDLSRRQERRAARERLRHGAGVVVEKVEPLPHLLGGRARFFLLFTRVGGVPPRGGT